MSDIEFEPNVLFSDVLSAPLKLTDGCHFYSFPLGIISIINFLIILTILISTVSAFLSCEWGIGLVIFFGGIISQLFMIYVQAYLIKGCQCAQKLKKTT